MGVAARWSLPWLLALPFAAAASGQALDLSVPEQPMFSDGATSPYRNDPPGTWYGDTSGVPPSEDEDDRALASRCPTAPDGSPRTVTGSVTTGFGWSSHGGNSRYNGLDLNFCKERSNDEGEDRSFNASIHIDQIEGDGYGGYYRGRPGPYGPPPRGRR